MDKLDPMAPIITLTAGEDLRCGDNLEVATATGKVIRHRGEAARRIGVALQDYREGDVVVMPVAWPPPDPMQRAPALPVVADAPYTRENAIEHLAAIEHERWVDWQEHLHGLCEQEIGRVTDDPTGALIIPVSRVLHWERLIATSYADLPPHSQQSDRDQVARYWPWLVEFVAGWIEHHGPAAGPVLADMWREEMS